MKKSTVLNSFGKEFKQEKFLHFVCMVSLTILGFTSCETVVGQAIPQVRLPFYGKPGRYSYFAGGSMGGRQGISEAMRFPDDYNGILSF